jgi:hypothetical protein
MIQGKKVFVLLCCVFLLLLGGCGAKEVKLDAAATADKLASEVTFKDQLSPLKDKAAFKLFGLDDSTVASPKSLCGDRRHRRRDRRLGMQGRECRQNRCRSAAEQRVKDQTQAFANYVPGELTKLKSPFIKTYGKYVVYVCCDDTAQVQKVIDSFTK